LFVDICFTINAQLGRAAAPAVPPGPSALAALAAELRDPSNLAFTGEADTFVVLRPPDARATVPVLSPAGRPVWRQRLAPLGLLLTRLQGRPLARAETVTVSGPQLIAAERDWFAPGGFADLTDAEALHRRAFEQLQAGARLGFGDSASSDPITHTVQF